MSACRELHLLLEQRRRLVETEHRLIERMAFVTAAEDHEDRPAERTPEVSEIEPYLVRHPETLEDMTPEDAAEISLLGYPIRYVQLAPEEMPGVTFGPFALYDQRAKVPAVAQPHGPVTPDPSRIPVEVEDCPGSGSAPRRSGAAEAACIDCGRVIAVENGTLVPHCRQKQGVSPALPPAAGSDPSQRLAFEVGSLRQQLVNRGHDVGRLLDLLWEVQWCGGGPESDVEGNWCPFCSRPEDGGAHSSSCRLARALEEIQPDDAA